MEQDYYTCDMVNEIFNPKWFDDMFRRGVWCSGVEPLTPSFPIGNPIIRMRVTHVNADL